MKTVLEIPYLTDFNQHSSAEELAVYLNDLPSHWLLYTPWQQLMHRPAVSFVIAHGEGAIFLKYFVEEETLRSTYLQPNDPVYNDSCVEFFIAFAGEENYYNFEFNCAGTCLAGFGSGRERLLLPVKDILKIRHHSRVLNLKVRPEHQQSQPLPVSKQHPVQWELTVVIPADVFIYHDLSTFRNISSRGNFFKCGDALPEPHYLTWNNIVSPCPDFHQKEFFAAMDFLS